MAEAIQKFRLSLVQTERIKKHFFFSAVKIRFPFGSLKTEFFEISSLKFHFFEPNL